MVDMSRLAFYAGSAFCAVALVFGAGLYSGQSDNAIARGAFGVYNDARTLIEEIPNLTHKRPIHYLQPARYPGKGVTVNKTSGDDIVMVTGFLGDDQKVELIRRNGAVLASWRILPTKLLPNVGQCRNVPQTDWNSSAHNVLVQPDGSIIFSFESCGMIKLDRCGNKQWATREVTHHSPNFLERGGFVTGGSVRISAKTQWPFTSPYWEDLIYTYDANGKLIGQRKITELLMRNGMLPLITSFSQDKPKTDGEFHLNEIEELPRALASAFPMFAPGDLLVSLRNLNMILVTDAKAETIKWYKVGPWIRQHDPDWQADGRITVFDNHQDGTEDGSHNGGSRIIAINPATGETETLYGGRKDQYFFSRERGMHQRQPDGGIMIAEANQGRAFQVDRAGKIVWEYVNRFDDRDSAWLNGAESYPSSYFTVKDWSCH